MTERKKSKGPFLYLNGYRPRTPAGPKPNAGRPKNLQAVTIICPRCGAKHDATAESDA